MPTLTIMKRYSGHALKTYRSAIGRRYVGEGNALVGEDRVGVSVCLSLSIFAVKVGNFLLNTNLSISYDTKSPAAGICDGASVYISAGRTARLKPSCLRSSAC